MLDETERARSTSNLFGYEIEWQHRFNDDPASPLYMQIRLGESVLHLNGHAGPDDPRCDVRDLVRDLEGLVQALRERGPRGRTGRNRSRRPTLCRHQPRSQPARSLRPPDRVLAAVERSLSEARLLGRRWPVPASPSWFAIVEKIFQLGRPARFSFDSKCLREPASSRSREHSIFPCLNPV